MTDEENDKVIDSLVKYYRGLRKEDLNSLHPHKSCVICAHIDCIYHNHPNTSCSEHSHITELNWMLFYNFYKD
jgi:hypothetical protein